jgi:bacillithiol biosynthesis deacetylase BshB1
LSTILKKKSRAVVAEHAGRHDECYLNLAEDRMKLDVLVIAPHPDDAELGAAGAILKMKADGAKVGILDLTSGEPTPYGSLEKRAQETAAATQILGIDWRDNLGLPNRSLEPTLEARHRLAGVIRQTKPRWLFAPYWVDAHPDHLAATELVDAARFWSKLTKSDIPGEPHHPERIYNYYCVHLKMTPQPAFILDISPFWEKKLAAIQCYHSQFIEGRSTEPPTFIDRLRDEASYWGKAIGVKYGEPFNCREPLGLSSLTSLV